MNTDTEIKATVRERYGAIATAPAGACGCCGEAGADLALDTYEGVAGHVPEADLGLGCGLPTRHAGIREGDTVLDLGAGAGNDAFVARALVGERGRVIGVDMTAAMVDRARANAAKLGYANVEFRLGELEALPVADASVDVAISNCVLNLVPDKAGAFAEIFRVLRPGARFCISDVVASAPLPDTLRAAAELHVGCVAGAMERDRYLELIRAAGFSDVRIAETKAIDLPDALLLEHLDPEGLAAFRAEGTRLLSVTLLGTKPDTACCDAGCCR
ncbi:MAG TPA: arsenite methyltransferase [Geminicoccaceae bacterium]|nr:arsenite methyltransferase [Geminicoccaceae bacterium]